MQLIDNMIAIVGYSYDYNKQCDERIGRVNKISMVILNEEYYNQPTWYEPKLDD